MIVSQKTRSRPKSEILTEKEIERVYRETKGTSARALRSQCDCEQKEICRIYTEDLREDARRMRIYREVKHLIEPCPLKEQTIRWIHLSTWHGWTEWHLEEYDKHSVDRNRSISRSQR